MKFEQTLTGKIEKRYKRFLADITLDNGEFITAHTPNTGSMKTCWEPGWKVVVSKSNNPKRKLPYTLELTHNGRSWIQVNTSRTNKLVHEALDKKIISELKEYSHIKPETKVGKSRIDFLLTHEGLDDCYVEVKNVTLSNSHDHASFPDSVSERGLKHINELMELKSQGCRVAMLYIIGRTDVSTFGPAFDCDPKYSQALVEAQKNGLEVLAYQCQLSEKEVHIAQSIPLRFS